MILLGITSQLTFTSSKSSLETLKKGVKNERTREPYHLRSFVLVLLLLTLNIFHTFF